MRSFYGRAASLTPSIAKEAVRTLATRLGCLIARLPTVQTLGGHLRLVFERFGITCVYDVGAHVGQYGRFLRNIGYRGRIVSFEPVSANYARLSTMARKDPRWEVHQLALGDADTTAPINITQITQFTSFLTRSAYSRDLFGDVSSVIGVEDVAVARLDTLISNGRVPFDSESTFLKMDTQGYDLRVLEGAGEFLADIAAVQSELSVRAIYEGSVDYLEAMRRMEGMGFDLSTVMPVDQGFDDLRAIELDAIMTNHKLARRATG